MIKKKKQREFSSVSQQYFNLSITTKNEGNRIASNKDEDNSKDSNDDTDGSSNDSSGEEGDIIDEEDAPQSQNWMTAFASY